jgi:hypothetical protein
MAFFFARGGIRAANFADAEYDSTDDVPIPTQCYRTVTSVIGSKPPAPRLAEKPADHRAFDRSLRRDHSASEPETGGRAAIGGVVNEGGRFVGGRACGKPQESELLNRLVSSNACFWSHVIPVATH